MATFLLDLDGTLFKHSSTMPLPGALEFLAKIHADGNRVVFITRRGDEVGV